MTTCIGNAKRGRMPMRRYALTCTRSMQAAGTRMDARGWFGHSGRAVTLWAPSAWPG